MKRSDGFIGNDFHWFIGEVEDINDTELYNRVKVRAYGYYELTDKGGPSTEDLPWATVMMPTTSASKKGIGISHGLMVGSWVVGFFRDGSSAQDPIILGSIQTATNNIVDSPSAFTDFSEDGKASINNKITAVHKDDTFRIEHQSGSRIVMDKDGNIDIFAASESFLGGGDVTIRSGRRGKTKVI